MKHTGWRKPTPDLGGVCASLRAGEGRGVSETNLIKARALTAVKRIGAQLGLKAADILLLDMLGAFSQEGDWAEDARPIVWPSNATLMTRTGFSLSALKRRVRRLAEAGLIAFVDSPNGKRWGRRDRAGHITEAYGFDLTPLRARTLEFEALERQLQAEQERRSWLHRRITITRRSLQADLDAAMMNHPLAQWDRPRALLAALLTRIPKRTSPLGLVETMLARLERLRGHIARRLHGNRLEADTMRVISEPHIPTTNQPESVKNPAAETLFVEPASEISLTDIERVCPEFVSWGEHFQDPPKDWPSLARLADALHAMIGISAPTWAAARATLGPHTAPAALALIFEKTCRGIVTAPDAYLRGLLRRAPRGELRLERSFRSERMFTA